VHLCTDSWLIRFALPSFGSLSRACCFIAIIIGQSGCNDLLLFALPGKLSSLALGNREERRASHGLPPSVGVFTSMESAYLTEGFHQDTLQEFETFRALQALEWEVAMGLSEAEQ
jgi:hypothetical protein